MPITLMENPTGMSFVISAPGKVILFGEHSVVYKKAALSASISKRICIYVKILDKPSNEISINLPQVKSKISCNLQMLNNLIKEVCPLLDSKTELRLEEPGDINHNEYIKTLNRNLVTLGINLEDHQESAKSALLGVLFIMRGMFSTLKCNMIPFSIEVKSELEIGAGTGSSAAFAVSLAGSFLYLSKYLQKINNRDKPLNKDEHLDTILVTEELEFSAEDLSTINKWAFCVEKITHGNPSGIDNTTCTFGSVVLTSQVENQSQDLHFTFLKNVPKIKVLLISTGVSRNTSHLVAKVRHLRERNCAVVDAIFNAMDVIAQEASKSIQALSSCSSDDLKTSELYRILNDLVDLNHGLLRTLGVSHDSLECIVNLSKKHGLSSKLTGAGGGGNAITLVPPSFSKDQLEALIKLLEPQFKVTEINLAEEGIRIELQGRV